MSAAFEAVKSSVDIVDAAQRYGLQVVRGGKAHCPWHTDRSFRPKKPILENIRERIAAHREEPTVESPPVLETRPPENSIDQVIDLYQLDDD